MSDFHAPPIDAAEARREADLKRFNAARATRGLRPLEYHERERRDAMVLAYADLGPGEERDQLSRDIDALDRPDAPEARPRKLGALRSGPAAWAPVAGKS